MPEQYKFPEVPLSEEAVVSRLLIEGNNNPEAHRMLIELAEQFQAEAARINTGRANVECSFKLARIYFKTGYKQQALQDMEEAWYMAQQEPGCEDLVIDIQVEIARIEKLI